MTMKKRLAVDTSTAMSVMALVSLLLLAAAYVLYRQKALSSGTVAFLGDAATAAGLLVVVIGIWLAAMALRQTERSSDIGVAAARQWLVDRRKLESQIDYLFFASPHIFAEILAGEASPDGTRRASVADAAKSLIGVIGTLRRLRDTLLGYTQNHGLLLALAGARRAVAKADGDPFTAYLQVIESGRGTPVTSYLRHAEGWLFRAPAQGGVVSLSTATTVQALTRLVCAIDYLDERAVSIQAVLEKESCGDRDAEGLLAPSARGAEMLAILQENLKEIFLHLAVLRACMEKEWALLFPDGFPDNAAGEDAIRALLAEADNDRFAFATDPGSRDSFSGYRFGHALVQLSHLGVFDDGSGPHSRVRSLYGTPAPRAPAA